MRFGFSSKLGPWTGWGDAICFTEQSERKWGWGISGWKCGQLHTLSVHFRFSFSSMFHLKHFIPVSHFINTLINNVTVLMGVQQNLIFSLFLQIIVIWVFTLQSRNLIVFWGGDWFWKGRKNFASFSHNLFIVCWAFDLATRSSSGLWNLFSQ